MRRTRYRRVGVVAVSLGLVASLSASLQSVENRPVSEVRGAVGTPAPVANRSAEPWVDSRLVYPRDTTPLTPRTGTAALAPQPGELTGYVWPLSHGRITLPFKAIPGGTRIKDGKLFHDGIDLATFCGDRVRAAHDGVVLAAGRRFDDQVGWIGDLAPYYAVLDRKKLWDDLPNVVVIDDGNGYRSVYAHMSTLTVGVGDRVKAGQKIGLEGRTGHASGCHVHYGLFSPLETKTFGVRDDLLRKLRLPTAEIARIDPILVLPDGAEALRTRRFPPPVAATPSVAPAVDPVLDGGPS